MSDPEEEPLPRVQFLTRREVLVLSSDSEEDQERHKSHAVPTSRGSKSRDPPPPRPLAAPKKKNTSGAGPSRAQPGPPVPKKGKKNPETVTVLIDPGVLQNAGGGLVLSSLQSQEIQCVIQTQPVPRSITWSRMSEDANGEGPSQEQAEVLILVSGEEFVAMMENCRKEPPGSSSKETLDSYVTRVKAGRSWKVPTLVIMEMEKYFRGGNKLSKKKQKEPVVGELNGKKRQNKQKEAQGMLPVMNRVEVEEVLMTFQLQTGVHVWFLETWKELADFVCMFTKAVTEAPTKRQRDNTSFSFYLDGEWAGGVRVERCGKGLLEVWRRQIQQFNRISVDIANAVVAAYPSPQLLVKAYRCCRTEEERHKLLSDILVRRGEGVTSTSRRVGPEMSKRIYLQMMSKEPELSLEFT
ncbi:hypothetical protein GDO86_013959 [Hymenochirus boettgeri]|uniref:ERCC4 domain-containing protein n=1 Tax=Hymenochirus boettgeri TaxID=247094 RepID=A0A8T2JPU7_9PIPI|nr:hypothetical protein GDO86_013959 [Hymenochirus boettgeri]